jgi:hypothetical protein
MKSSSVLEDSEDDIALVFQGELPSRVQNYVARLLRCRLGLGERVGRRVARGS